ncbi:MAG: hypothetical protein JJU29_07040 [Verrucomicrobia bacterium]|nr:hypothetical protein [Verrucomicrobiota bacterium]MCH8510773.1 hypothetical protein [Kiritimatiellia bacterium]
MNNKPLSSISTKGVSLADSTSGWRANANFLLPTNYELQFEAIRSLLQDHEKNENELQARIEELERKIEASPPETEIVPIIQRIDCLESSVFLHAAHSMSALGALAPFFESLFHTLFLQIKPYFEGNGNPHDRWKQASDDAWDCHFHWVKGKRNKGIVEGIRQLSQATDFEKYLPVGYDEPLQALFAYRNKMFHCGFEWSESEKKKFQKMITDHQWYPTWFECSKSGGEPWIYYMSSPFIERLLELIDEILQAVGRYTGEVIRVKSNENHGV